MPRISKGPRKDEPKPGIPLRDTPGGLGVNPLDHPEVLPDPVLEKELAEIDDETTD